MIYLCKSIYNLVSKYVDKDKVRVEDLYPMKQGDVFIYLGNGKEVRAINKNGIKLIEIPKHLPESKIKSLVLIALSMRKAIRQGYIDIIKERYGINK